MIHKRTRQCPTAWTNPSCGPHHTARSACAGSTWLRISIAATLAIVTLAVYAQVARFQYVTWDDSVYVYENPDVTAGLSLKGIAWAFTSEHAANWHPLTGISHMLDCTLFPVDRDDPHRAAGNHHVINVLWHVVCVILLFVVLDAMTAAPWRSAIVAALFALHPQHVESVAWISQRKDVLSTALMLLSLLVYVRYVRLGGPRKYTISLLLFAGALLAKPMVVMFPVLLILLDYWPFNRWGGLPQWTHAAHPPAVPRRAFKPLVIEKLPFFGLSLATGIATVIVQAGKDASIPLKALGLADRFSHAVVAYVLYIAKMFWPADLTCLYPHPYMPYRTPAAHWSQIQTAGAIAILVVITVVAIRASRYRYGIVGWLWFLVALLPVIGLMQVGSQSIADRYTYVSFVGLFIIIVWAVGDLLRHFGSTNPVPRIAAGVVTTILLVTCAARTYAQIGTWRDSETLYRHAIHTAPDVPLIYNNLGGILKAQGDVEGSIEAYRQAVRLMPKFSKARNTLVGVLLDCGRSAEAIPHIRSAIDTEPRNPAYRDRLAWILATHPDPTIRNGPEAVNQAEKTVELTQFQDASHLDTLAAAYAATNRFNDAITTALRAQQLLIGEPNPDIARGLRQRILLYRHGRPFLDPQLKQQD